jgi:hypothetical protein
LSNDNEQLNMSSLNAQDQKKPLNHQRFFVEWEIVCQQRTRSNGGLGGGTVRIA